MEKIRIPVANWATALAQAVKTAGSGATIVVNTPAKLQLGKIAAARLGREDILFEVDT